MHFSIPDTELVQDSSGATYIGFHIYINGAYHCCLRYKQLHALHEQLRRWPGLTTIQLPPFPPKRLLPLTNGQLETRRAALEHYLQLIGQDAQISKLEMFQNFLLTAQYETAAAEESFPDDMNQDITVEVVLSNDYQLQINCSVIDNATTLLQKVCQCIQLPTHMLPYFCLFLMRKDIKNTPVLLRRLMDFESPFLSRLHAKPCQILVRKSYWNPVYDMNLLHDEIALNLLFIQTVTDVECEWIIAPPEMRQKLRSLQEHSMKKEYLEMARQLPLYGCLQFTATNVDYSDSQTNSPVLISIGNRELSVRTIKGTKIYETKFRVTRMRCWRVTAIHNTLESRDTPSNLQLSFEYLMSKQTLRWITITSAQAMLISVCLQSMVDELLNCKDTSLTVDKSENSPSAYSNCSSATISSYTSNNGRISSSLSTPSFTFSSTTNEQNSSSTSTASNSSYDIPSPTAPVQFLSSITQQRTRSHNHKNPKITTPSYAAVFFRNAQDSSIHNEAFEGIGDDDL